MLAEHAVRVSDLEQERSGERVVLEALGPRSLDAYHALLGEPAGELPTVDHSGLVRSELIAELLHRAGEGARLPAGNHSREMTAPHMEKLLPSAPRAVLKARIAP